MPRSSEGNLPHRSAMAARYRSAPARRAPSLGKGCGENRLSSRVAGLHSSPATYLTVAEPGEDKSTQYALNASSLVRGDGGVSPLERQDLRSFVPRERVKCP